MQTKQHVKVKSTEQLKQIIEQVDIHANLNYLDVSEITNMNYMFYGSKFNGDISE